MSIIPCSRNDDLKEKIEEYSEALRRQAHLLGDHGLSAEEFYASGVFRGAIERIRGQFSASMKEKREWAAAVLDQMVGQDVISSWSSAGDRNRHDYSVTLKSGRTAAIELKGCLDGNNTNIFERPPHAHEFIIWSLCTNPGADPRHNVWSGIHTRLGTEIIDRAQQIDGLVVWDMVCGTIGRPCPKLQQPDVMKFSIGDYTVPPPCVYVFPATIPSPRNNPHPAAQNLSDVEILKAFSDCFKAPERYVNQVTFEVSYKGVDTVRTTKVERDGVVAEKSKATPIRRR